MGSRMGPDRRRLMYNATYITAPSIAPTRSAGELDRGPRLVLGLF